MNKFSILILALFSFLSFAGEPNIVVFGDGESIVPSDEWTFSFEISIKEKTRDSLISQYNKIKEEAYKKLSALGVKEKELKTDGFAINPWSEWENNSNVKKGYMLSHHLNLKTEKFELINKIIIALSPIVGVSIGSMSHLLKSETHEKEMNKLYAKAYASAKIKIDAILSASDKKLKRIEYISEDLSSSPSPMLMLGNDRANSLTEKSSFAGNSGPNIQLSLIPLDLTLNMRLKVIASFE
jgi:uncharacterized protein YggE